ncbi:hypothetical protein B0H19DRAFT_1072409 [Mycena capillaripes]|nr:hypothetical protein B0H19DRAFT_1072409 [Mycena capillaripes]
MASVPDDPNRCLGRESNGSQCICKRCTQTVVIENKTLCANCLHIESAHPDTPVPVGALLQKFRDAGRLGTVPKTSAASSSSSSAKATEAEAEVETNSGLRKRKKTTTDTEPGPSKRPKAKGLEMACYFGFLPGEWVDIGTAVALVCGSFGKPGALVLGKSKAPNIKEIDDMKGNKLALYDSPDQRIRIHTSWSTERCTKLFRSLFPELFRYLDAHPPKFNASHPRAVQLQQWLAVIKTKQSIALSSEQLPTGSDLAHHCKKKGHAAAERTATKIRVPSRRFVDWEADSESEEQAEEEEPDFDSLDGDDASSPLKPTPKSKGKAKMREPIDVDVEFVSNSKGKGKARAIEPTDIEEKISTVKVEEAESEPLPDMKLAAKMRTRLDTKTIRWNTIIMPSSSDDERTQPIEVSDDELEMPTTLLPAAPTTAVDAASSTTATSSVTSSSWTTPLFTSSSHSPEPENSTLFDDFHFNSAPPSPIPVSGNFSGWASTSSLTSSSSHLPAPPVSHTPAFSLVLLLLRLPFPWLRAPPAFHQFPPMGVVDLRGSLGPLDLLGKVKPEFSPIPGNRKELLYPHNIYYFP